MKYFNFKRYKFSTITKSADTIRNYFFKILKSIDFRKAYKYLDYRRYYFLRIYKLIDLRKAYKYLDYKRYNFLKIHKLKDIKEYDFYKIQKKFSFKNYKYLHVYFFIFIILSGFIYLTIPTFYSYNKSSLEKIICNNEKIKCTIKGKVNYSFYPNPRIKIKNLVFKDFGTIEDVAIKLSIKNLLNKKEQNFRKIEFRNFEINFDLKKYKNFIVKELKFIPITFKKGNIKFFEGKNYIASINDAKLNLLLDAASIEAELTGKFLDDNMNIFYDSKKIDNKISTNITLKLLNSNFFTKVDFTNSTKDKKVLTGNVVVKQNKNKFTGIFNYENNEISIVNSNLRNTFLDGKLEGKIKFLPYFVYNLDVNLNSLNFTKLYNYFLTLDKKSRDNLFKINNKINGKINFSSDKIYSKYNVAKSFESRIQFHNGNIAIEQFLLNLGKLGAADILGTINNDKKFTNFKFESNIFIDNQKKFLSKFGIYNKKNISSNLFIAGNFDLENIKATFYEISDDKKFNIEDINYIEQEFNNLMLSDGYIYLFNFPKFKDFIKLITNEK